MTTGGDINRNAWAQLIAGLIQSETKGKKAPFARLIGVDARTLDRWLKREVNVSEASVRDVAKAVGRAPMDVLVQVGYYEVADIAPPTPTDPRQDPIIREILADPRLTEDERVQLVQMQLDRIEQDLARRRAEYEWLRKQHTAS